MAAEVHKKGLVELLAYSNADFDTKIKEMSLKDLLDTIATLQKEMGKEQENFNSLSAERSSLKKNSQQYKQISKEMTESQTRLTALMDRSMKCFQQQGNQTTSTKFPNVQRRSSLKETSEKQHPTKPVQRNQSARISNFGGEITQAKSTPDLFKSSNQPVFLKSLTNVTTSKIEVKRTADQSNGKPSMVKPVHNYHNGGTIVADDNLKKPSVKSSATFNLQKSQSHEFLANNKPVNGTSVNKKFGDSEKQTTGFNVVLRKTNRSLIDNEEQENNFRHSVDLDLRKSSDIPLPNKVNNNFTKSTDTANKARIISSANTATKSKVLSTGNETKMSSMQLKHVNGTVDTAKPSASGNHGDFSVNNINNESSHQDNGKQQQQPKQNTTRITVKTSEPKQQNGSTITVKTSEPKPQQNGTTVTVKPSELNPKEKYAAKHVQHSEQKVAPATQNENYKDNKTRTSADVKVSDQQRVVKSSAPYKTVTAAEARAVATGGERQNLLQEIQNFKRKPVQDVVVENDVNDTKIVKSSIKPSSNRSSPAMSDSTQARIERLRELERIRHEKQAALLAKRNSDEPVPMPKFVSSVKLKSGSDDVENKENISTDNVLSNKAKDAEIKSASSPVRGTQSEEEHIVTEDVELPTLQAKNTNISKSKFLSTSDVSSETSKGIKEVSKTLQTVEPKLDSVSKHSDNQSLDSVRSSATARSVTASSDQSSPTNRTVSTSYVSGPLSPTSTEKTKISVVRKTKLDSLPSVTMTTDEPVSAQSAKQNIVLDTNKTNNESAGTGPSKDQEITTDSSCPVPSNVPLLGDSRSETVTSAFAGEDKNKGTEPMVQKSVTETVTVSRLQSHSEEKCDSSAVASSDVKQSDKPKTETPQTVGVKQSNVIIAKTESLSVNSDMTATEASDLKDSNLKNSGAETNACPAIPQTTSAAVEADQPSFRLGTLAMKQALESSARIEEKFSNVTEDRSSQMAKIDELHRQREQRKKALEEEAQEDLSGLSVRERFFRNQSVGRVARQARPMSIPEQIRASRLSRRGSENQLGRTSSPGKAAEAESPPLARRSRNQHRSVDRLRRRTVDSFPQMAEASRDVAARPVLDMDSLDKAFARPDRERMSRIEELDRIRLRNKEIMKRRDSAPQVSADGNTESGISRLDFHSSLIVTRGSTENITQFPIHEHLESNFEVPRSSTEDVASRARELLRSVSIDRTSSSSTYNRPPLRPSYSETRLFPSNGSSLSHSSVLSVSTNTDLQPSQATIISEDTDDTPVYIEGSPQGMPVIDHEGRTHWLPPTSPKLNTYLTVLGNLQSRNRNSSHDTSYTPPPRPVRVHLSDSLLEPSNLDHYLAECFHKKYSLTERCAMIKEKIYGKSKPQGKSENGKPAERGKPDGASRDCLAGKLD